MNWNIKRLIILVFCFFGHIFCSNADATVFSNTRHKAGLLALIDYNDTPSYQKSFSCKKAQIAGICRMMIQEGGYEPNRLYAILNIEDPEVEYVAMIINELGTTKSNVPRLGSLVLASTVAFAYTVPSADGMRAAVHAGRLGCVDKDCDAVCRAVYSLIIYAIEGKIEKKDDLIKVAALNADSQRVARVIRSVRLAEWRKLPKESTLVGRLARVLYLFRRAEGFSDAISMGRRKLVYPESRKLLAVLSACWTDLPYLPENFVWKALMEKDNREICAELYKLSEEAILAAVPEEMVYGSVQSTYNKSVETINGLPAGQKGSIEGEEAVRPIKITEPSTPQAPRIPGRIKITEARSHVAITPGAPDFDDIKALEDSNLTPIKPLESLGMQSSSRNIKVVKPVDMFGESYFAE